MKNEGGEIYFYGTFSSLGLWFGTIKGFICRRTLKICCAMGLFDVLLGVALLDSMQKNKRQSNNSSSFWGSNDSYNDYGAYSDRSLDDDCDCGHCSDHDYDESCFGRDDDSFGW